ncbi:unnamed protein product [Lepeophtheirus salmonis]|uniref:(salmon louse) hypothetical protein n=1 Tax=Lepeophtheirus salmonis TaxID=72036 RepID=A0A7R8D066_LEPSM|nr:unnamed protein product [Lepeophtheirus salmonis]CAF2981252.1 unnamed protein product [Lepeophtheirus salmonis]
MSIAEKVKSKKSLNTILADGCGVNTRPEKGAIRFVELELQQALRIIICLLHENELPFRHLFEEIDGKTEGPGNYTGFIGKTISSKDGLNLKPPEEGEMFEAADGKVHMIDYEIKNNDIDYLYPTCDLVQDGPIKGDLSILTRNL